MKEMIKLGMAFAIGATSAALFSKVYWSKKHEQVHQDDQQTIEFLRQRLENERARYDGYLTEVQTSKDEVGPTKAVVKESKREKVAKTDYTQYASKPDLAEVAAKYIDPAETASPAEDSGAESMDEEPVQEIHHNLFDDGMIEPHMITQEEFDNEMLHYDKRTITYYAEDDVLCDENEDVIDDPERTVGENALSCFGWGCDDYDIVHVRNPRLSQDYEIIREHKSYAEYVAGIYMED